MDFSADGRTLATASADGTVRLWDVEPRTPIGSPLTIEADTFLSAAVSRGGSQLFALSTRDRGVRFATDPEVWKRHACVVAGRELTRREWSDALAGRQYRPVCGAN